MICCLQGHNGSACEVHQADSLTKGETGHGADPMGNYRACASLVSAARGGTGTCELWGVGYNKCNGEIKYISTSE